MSRFYLSAAYPRREEMAAHARELRDLGHTVVSTWHAIVEDFTRDDGRRLSATPEARGVIIACDLADIRACDVFMAFTEPEGGYTRGTRHFELGAALAWNKGLMLIGPREEMLGHWLAGLDHYQDWQECLAFLRMMRGKRHDGASRQNQTPERLPDRSL